jgi:hypothetical protein
MEVVPFIAGPFAAMLLTTCVVSCCFHRRLSNRITALEEQIRLINDEAHRAAQRRAEQTNVGQVVYQPRMRQVLPPQAVYYIPPPPPFPSAPPAGQDPVPSYYPPPNNLNVI